ncbi:MAG: hypothetical protein ACHQ6U_11005 [Thermodesulfobacteriota bacterium]
MPYIEICEKVKIPYPSVKRWRVRLKRQTDLVKQPGPFKIQAPDLNQLKEEIAKLPYGKHRTKGAGKLYGLYQASLSRRDLNQLIAQARHEQNTENRQHLKRIVWNVPNVAWSMDPCEYNQRDEFGKKVYLNQMQDLASRYKFSPLSGNALTGEEISGYLAEIFNRFGAPLFLKRDNGSNLNYKAVNETLEEYFVIPVNSPVHYPPYNGAIEEAQTELKAGLNQKLLYRPYCPSEHLEAYASAVEHELNHRLRPCLNHQNACQVYFKNRRVFTKWERREAYDWIIGLQSDILRENEVQLQTAWRIAVETWLNKKGYITITINGKVSPN